MIDGCKVREHHRGPRHKTVESQLGLFFVDELVEPCHHLERVRGRARRGRLHKPRKGVERWKSSRCCQPLFQGVAQLRHHPVARDHHGQAVQRTLLTQWVRQDGFQDFVEERGFEQGG